MVCTKACPSGPCSPSPSKVFHTNYSFNQSHPQVKPSTKNSDAPPTKRLTLPSCFINIINRHFFSVTSLHFCSSNPCSHSIVTHLWCCLLPHEAEQGTKSILVNAFGDLWSVFNVITKWHEGTEMGILSK